MPRSSARGYVEPVAAIAAVVAVATGLTIYVGVLGNSLGTDERPVAPTVLEDVREAGGTLRVVSPDDVVDATPPAGWHANVTLATRAGRWTSGPAPPADAGTARAEVAVRLGPGTVRPGHLTVEVWP
jgi:alkaline phosphatase